MIEVLGSFKARIRIGEFWAEPAWSIYFTYLGSRHLVKGTNKEEAETGGVKTEMCVGGGGWAGGHDLRVGVKRGVKKKKHWVPDRELLMISWMSPVQEGSWEAPGRPCCAPVPYL